MIVHIRYRPRNLAARFVHPIDPVPRTAILVAGFRETRVVRVFSRGWDDRAARFRATAVAGPIEQLRRLLTANVRLEHAVIALSYPGDRPLSPWDREVLWRALGVPVFEQYLDRKNRLLAMECDAHSGMHVVSGCAGLDVESDVCPCGNRTPRLSRAKLDARMAELAGLLA
jgi:hypothetical protein